MVFRTILVVCSLYCLLICRAQTKGILRFNIKSQTIIVQGIPMDTIYMVAYLIVIAFFGSTI